MRSKGDVGRIAQFLSDGDEESTLATWLQQARMRTPLVGKYLNGYGLSEDLTYIPPAWSDWAGVTREGYARFESNEGGNRSTTAW